MPFLGMLTGTALVAPIARADEAQEFEGAKTRFEVSEYAEAARRFDSLLDPSKPVCAKGPTDGTASCRITDAELVERARALLGATWVALGHGHEADAQFEAILRANPTYVPNPAVLPAVVIDRFIEVKTRLAPELDRIFRASAEKEREHERAMLRAREAERKWLGELERMASEERVTVQNSRAVALLPFGIGQFQNGDARLGWALCVGQLLSGAASIASAVVQNHAVASAFTPHVDLVRLGDRVSIAHAVNVVSFTTFAALAVGGVIQAEVAFVPERSTVRTRPIPPPPSTLVPTVSAGADGLGFGVAGRF